MVAQTGTEVAERSPRELSDVPLGGGAAGDADVEVPAAFLEACGGNRKKALAKYQAALKWKQDHHIEELMTKSYPAYDVIKRAYSQTLHGTGHNGEVVSIESGVHIDFELLKANGLSHEALATHLAVMFEFTARELGAGAPGSSLTIMDLKDLPLHRMATPDRLRLITSVSTVMDHLYPGRQKKILILNAPKFCGTVFNLVKGVMPGSIANTLEFASSVEDLTKYIPLDQLPPHIMGGTSTVAFGEHPNQLKAQEFFGRLSTPN